LLGQAAALPPGAEREALLIASTDDAALRQEVLSLLAVEPPGSLDIGAAIESLVKDVSGESALPGAPAPRLGVGEVLSGRFRVIQFLGRGGMAEVYCAEDLELKESVAIKVLDGALATQPDFLNRFRREIRLSRQVGHPNVARVYDLVQEPHHASGSLHFYALELLRGETLAERLSRTGRMESAEALAIGRQLAAGLDAAHATGVIHRDFKPSNIILAANRAVIMDFGLAAAIPPEGAKAGVRATSVLLGTPGYVAPEQWAGQKATTASDIYAFGVVLHEMLTGKHPSSSGLGYPDVPAEWRAVVEKALAADPKARWQSATQAINRVRIRRISRRQILWGTGVGAALGLVAYRLGDSAKRLSLGNNQKVLLPRVDNQTGDESLNAWSTLLGRQLDLSQRLQPSGESLDPIDPIAVRGVAIREGVPLVAFAALSSAAGELVLRLRLELVGSDPKYASRVWRREWPARGRQDLMQLASAAGDWVREIAGELPEEIQSRRQAPELLSSASWDALRLYGMGDAAKRSGELKAALAYYSEAERIDSTFALATARVADLEAQLYNLDRSLESQRRASRVLQDNGTTTREALRIRMNHAVDCWNFKDGLAVAELAQAQFPEEAFGYFFAADFHRYLGRYSLAIPLYREAQEKDPKATYIRDKLIVSLLGEQRISEAMVEFGRKYTTTEEPWIRRIEGMLALSQRDFGRAEKLFKAMVTPNGNASTSMRLFSALHLATLTAEKGSIGDSIREFEGVLEGCRRMNRNGESAALCIQLAELHLWAGDKGKARLYAVEAGAGGGYLLESLAGEYLCRTSGLGRRPDWHSAAVPFANARTEAAGKRLAAEKALAEGHFRDAISLWGSARKLSPSNLFPHGLVRVLLAAGQWNEIELLTSELRGRTAAYLGRALDYPPGALFRL
jgi:serine/threonine protein kinase/tetratricopeptide (TPR) repeat protein